MTRFVISVFVVILRLGFAQAEPIGLVLAGGGAKGAYEVGVWQAMSESGCAKDVVAISGTSVGALNAALFATVKDPKKCETAWLKSIGAAFTPNTNKVHDVLQKTIDDYDSLLAEKTVNKSEVSTADFLGAAMALVMTAIARTGNGVATATGGSTNAIGVCDSRMLRKVLNEILPDCTFPSHPAVYATAVNKRKSAQKVFPLSGLDRQSVVERLMASSALPLVFDSIEIDGEPYVDGGYELIGGDNVPISPIARNHPEVKTVVVVYLKEEAKVRRKIKAGDFPSLRIVEIFPSQDMGAFSSLFDTSAKKSQALIGLGRKDARRSLETFRAMNR